MRPGHFWICKFGTVPGSMSCVEKKFEMQVRKCEEYKGTRYYPSPGTDDASAPVAMLVNSSELCATDFHLSDVSPLQLDAVDRGCRRTHGETVRNLQVVGNSTFVLSVENDNDFRSRM
jgi:hypothetical protein